MPTFACALGGDDGRTLFALCATGTHDTDVAGKAQGAIFTIRVDVPHAGLPLTGRRGRHSSRSQSRSRHDLRDGSDVPSWLMALSGDAVPSNARPSTIARSPADDRSWRRCRCSPPISVEGAPRRAGDA